MEFSEKLQELRKQKNLTQDELANALFVSRTAVSKWESGRGYPSIDSLRTIAGYFSLTIDELLSSDELLTLAQKGNKQNLIHLKDLVFGLLDISVAILIFLPFFGQNAAGAVNAVSLLSLLEIPPYLRIAYYAVIACLVVFGVLTLALQNCQFPFWVQNKRKTSLILNTIGTLLFIVSQQPYAAVFLFVFLVIKALLLTKRQ